ncbi:hypothetical protein GH742_14285 [Legionella sp. MW5194]|uniref:branched-chain amino acid transport system II carrier protein n=1 Tax=Legionella sp. MW5194 TaxID=2662448 RepID=UPI00193DCDFF|nr:branched-chain amino acid transport system II carrier protein [Legionella sp. MW5194]QRN04936.1 hypothetical protein GH742_14285 [Legionella sp. MW5194]
MPHYKSIFVYGFAIFAMFFGSGNLVFPLEIGHAAGGSWVYGFFGLLLTGIFLPLAGLFVIKLHHGDYRAFFNGAGKLVGGLLPLLMLALLGSFGVVPRCITVAYGSMSYLIPQIHLLPFSLFFCLVTFLCCLDDRIMVKILGKWMSPVLIITLLILIGMAVIQSPDTTQALKPSISLTNGFLTGYQTMDLFAAFFFSALIFNQIQQQFPNADQGDIIRFAIKPSLLGASLLALVYLGFVYMGAHYQALLEHVKPELMLPAIAANTLGSRATLIMGVAMFFSCLTTAVALNNLFARYLHSSLKLSENRFPFLLAGTTLTSFIVSLLDFRGIAAFLAPVLEMTYPGVIALTLLGLILRKKPALKALAFYSITVMTLLIAGLSLVS